MSQPIFIDGSFTTLSKSLATYVGAALFETFLYGLYTILFAICLYTLLRRDQNLHRILLLFVIVMFALATADIIYTYYIAFAEVPKGELLFANLKPKYWLYVTNNVVADALLLYRCFAVWDFNISVISGPVILLLAGTVCGYVFEESSSFAGFSSSPNPGFDKTYIYLIMTFSLNAILTGLTAGRIWWVTRTARNILGTGLLQRYNTTIRILIESGVLYSAYIILDLALRRTAVAGTIVDAGLIQIVGIMPTLIIVQVGLGRAAHDAPPTRPEANCNKTTSIRSYQDNILTTRSSETLKHHHTPSDEIFALQMKLESQDDEVK